MNKDDTIPIDKLPYTFINEVEITETELYTW